MAAPRQLIKVVLPEPVGPLTIMFVPACTAASRKRAAGSGSVPSATSSSRE
jgi:hypothetical protein